MGKSQDKEENENENAIFYDLMQHSARIGSDDVTGSDDVFGSDDVICDDNVTGWID